MRRRIYDKKNYQRLFDTYNCVLRPNKSTFAIEYEESTVELTEAEIALLTKADKDPAINKELEPILKKVYAFMGLTGKTMNLSKAEYKHLCELNA